MNLRTPFVRDQKRDFASASGDELLRSQVRQILLTDRGELPWRTNFGSRLGRFRQRKNDAALSELARLDARDALRRWLPDATVSTLEVAADDNELDVSLTVNGASTRLRRGG